MIILTTAGTPDGSFIITLSPGGGSSALGIQIMDIMGKKKVVISSLDVSPERVYIKTTKRQKCSPGAFAKFL